MRGLKIIVADVSPIRFRAALSLALGQSALGGTAELFLSGEAVGLIRAPVYAPDDDQYRAIGQPALATLVDEALDAGIVITACQTGLDLCGATMADLDPRVAAGGIVSLLATLRDARLVVI